MKKILIFITVVIVAVLSFYLFEPIFRYTTGWKTLPDVKGLQPAIVHRDSISVVSDSVLIKAFKELEAPAISASVGINGNIVWSNSMGFADVENGIKATPKTIFRIGSVSKAITSIGLGVLLENGKLGLDSRVGDFVPYVSDEPADLTMLQVASHTSGIRNYGMCLCFPVWEYYNEKEYSNVQDAVDVFKDDALKFQPSSDFGYSTYNYTLLSAMMEGASGQDFSTFMKKNVFDKLGLLNTATHEKDVGKKLANFYDVEVGRYKASFPVNNTVKIAGGGMVATPEDLVEIGNALLNKSLFSEETMRLLITPVPLSNGEFNRENYALGWRNDETEALFDKSREINVIHHGGMAMGATSLLVLFPEYNMSIALSMNRTSESFDLFQWAYTLAESYIIAIDNGKFSASIDKKEVAPLTYLKNNIF